MRTVASCTTGSIEARSTCERAALERESEETAKSMCKVGVGVGLITGAFATPLGGAAVAAVACSPAAFNALVAPSARGVPTGGR